MTRYLDSRQSEDMPMAPDVPTLVRTNPRVKAILWSLFAAMVVLAMSAIFASHML